LKLSEKTETRFGDIALLEKRKDHLWQKYE